MRTCYAFKAAATADGADDLDIFDEIGFWGVQAKDFIAALKGSSAKTINVGINSPGGDVFAGIAIYNALKDSGKTINVKVLGLAASAASVIAMAGDTIEMPANSMMMVHNPWTFTAGNADDLRAEAKVLDQIGSGLQGIYANRSGQPAEKIAALLSTDTWLTAAEAKELGLATAVTGAVEAKAKFDLARADLPEAARAIFAASKKPPAAPAPSPAPSPSPAPAPVAKGPLAEQVITLVKEAGLEVHANAIALGATSIEDATARIVSAKEVIALCAITKSDGAAGFIAKNTPLADVRAALIKAQADADQHTSNVRKTNEQTPPAKAGVKTAKQIYDERNKRTAKKAGRK